MFYDDDSIVYIASLYQSVAEKELQFMEEYECPACSDLFCLYYRVIPYGMLYSEDPGVEVDLYFV